MHVCGGCARRHVTACRHPFARRLSDEAPAPAPAEGLEITFRGPDDKTVKLRLKAHTKMSKAFTAVCNKLALDESKHKFVFEGTVVKADDTPGGLGMEGGALISIETHQDGGNRC